MYDINNLNNEEKGMLYPTIDELTEGKLNRYQLAIGAARGARMITNEYVKQRVIAEKLQALQKEAGGKEAEKPISAMVDPEYRDQKAVRLSITKLAEGEYKLVEKDESEIVDVDAEFAKELAEEVAKIAKQKEALLAREDDDFDTWDDDVIDSDADEDEAVENEENEEDETAE